MQVRQEQEELSASIPDSLEILIQKSSSIYQKYQINDLSSEQSSQTRVVLSPLMGDQEYVTRRGCGRWQSPEVITVS